MKSKTVLARGPLVTTCPKRFMQNGEMYRWVAQELLGTDSPIVIGEIGFLESTITEDSDVGRIDNVLIHVDHGRLNWCALETQAVYFSGRSMTSDFSAIFRFKGDSLVFPTGIRRPDYRSSGPKRLMPQLQIKIPTLRRWGKKMAVVVDAAFFGSLGRMREVPELSNSDVIWFVVDYVISGTGANLVRKSVHHTTLEDAVEGLTAGTPVSLDVFEQRIKEKAGIS